jgi:predicted RND superfamily exporter protein
MSVRRLSLCLLRFSTRKPIWIILLTAAIFIFSLIEVRTLHQAGSIQDQLDPEMQTTQDLLVLRHDFSESQNLIAIVEPTAGSEWNRNQLCKLQQWLIALQDSHSVINALFTPFQIRTAVERQGLLHYPTLIPPPCETQEALNLQPLLHTPWKSLLTDQQAREFTISIGIEPEDPPGAYGSFSPDKTGAILQSADHGLDGMKVSWLGLDAQEFYTLKGMAQMQYLNLLVALIYLLGLRILFGTWRSGVIFLCSTTFTAGVVFAAMALCHHAVDALSSTLFLMISVASLQDFIFISYERLHEPLVPVRRHLRQLIVPSFWTSLTTAVGFGSLTISSLASIRHFGFWAAVAGMIEWVAIFLIFPAFLTTWPALSRWTLKKRSYLSTFGRRVTEFTLPKPAVYFSLLVFPLAVASVNQFNLAQTPTDVFPKSHPMSKSIEHLKESRGWVAEASVIFNPEFPRERRTALLDQLRRDPLVKDLEDREGVLDFMSFGATPERRDLISRDLSAAPLARRYESPQGKTRAILFLRDSQTEKINRLRMLVAAQCPNRSCYLAGDFVAYADFSRSLIETLFKSFFESLFLVAVILAYLNYKRGSSFANLMAILVATFWGPAVMMCLIYLMKVNVNMITCMVASILVGLAGDNAVQFLFASPKNSSILGGQAAWSLQHGIKRRSVGSLQCALLMALSSLILLGSYFEPPRMLGVLMALGFFTALIGDVYILKGLISERKST